jgi:hypothetical protein
VSGWKTATVEIEDVSDEVDEAVERRPEVKKLTYDTIGMAGYEAPIMKVVDEIVDGVDQGRVLVIEANDTTDSGSGRLYEISEDGVEIKETHHGYEGARAQDVRGYFEEHHDISGMSHL